MENLIFCAVTLLLLSQVKLGEPQKKYYIKILKLNLWIEDVGLGNFSLYLQSIAVAQLSIYIILFQTRHNLTNLKSTIYIVINFLC